MESTIVDKYKGFFEHLAFIPVSIRTEEGLVEARGVIENMIYSHEDLKKEIPFSYLNMENMLAEKTKMMEYPIINKKELLNLGSYCNLKTWHEVTECTRTLHDLVNHFFRSCAAFVKFDNFRSRVVDTGDGLYFYGKKGVDKTRNFRILLAESTLEELS
jgi:hypothetical protein